MPTLIFDLDGTLIDSRADLTCAVNLTRADFGLAPLALAAVTSLVGDGIYNLMNRALSDLAKPWDLEEAVAAMQRHYRDHMLDQTCLYPGVETTLRVLKDDWRLAVVTNKPEAEARKLCAATGLGELLDVIVGGGRCPHLKPRPEPLLLAVELAGSTVDGSWMIGDHRTDLGAARAAGLRACFCAYGFGIQDDQRADAVIQSFPDLLNVLRPGPRAVPAKQGQETAPAAGRAAAAGR